MALPGKLEEPPIHEVVCGVFFKPIAELDPVTLGPYWASLRSEYPRRQLKSPILPGGATVQFNVSDDLGPARTWLIGANDDFILQVQEDRFYVNWRLRDSAYPRFADEGEREGLLSRFLREFTRFTAFVRNDLGADLELEGLELSKLNRLVQGRHWSTRADLSQLFPALKGALDASSGGKPLVVSLRILEEAGDGALEWLLETLPLVMPLHQQALRLELRRFVRKSLGPADIEPVMRSYNEVLNELFVQLVPELFRFKKGWSP